jgi:hypothetical protein
MVNHGEIFVDPTMMVHTNNIEGTRDGLKQLVFPQKSNSVGLRASQLEFIGRHIYAGRTGMLYCKLYWNFSLCVA